MPVHVFLSYIRENSAAVDQLKHALINRDIQVWLDRDNLEPGLRWKAAIRRAIREGKIFIACFSAEYAARDKAWMNEELILAIEELRQRPVDRAWFIPIKLSPCEIPELEIGAGETLRDLQYVELYPDWDAGLQRLLSVILPHYNASSATSPPASTPVSASASSPIPTDQFQIKLGRVDIDDEVNLVNQEGREPSSVASAPETITSSTLMEVEELKARTLNVVNRKL